MRLDEFDYDLPEELIAQEPLSDRSSSRLLVLRRAEGTFEHRVFSDLVDLLAPGDLLVLNNTRVTALRLLGRKPSGGAVEALLLKPEGPRKFSALVRPAKRLKPGARITFPEGLGAVVLDEGQGGTRVVEFDDVGDFEARLATAGRVPLPPYIHKEVPDPERYQTVYAATGGSAAAPTAGLHFTPELLAALESKGVGHTFVTLDVGIDTFRPVQADEIEAHVMHGEPCSVSPAAAEAVNWAKGRIVAVGTTTVRVLETLVEERGRIAAATTVSKLFITPGFEFRAVDCVISNFHLPKTTMLLMMCAFGGREAVLRAYSQAVLNRYRFLSFGDSMIML